MKPFPGAKGHQLMDLTNAEESMSSTGGGRRKGFAVAHKDVFLGMYLRKLNVEVLQTEKSRSSPRLLKFRLVMIF